MQKAKLLQSQIPDRHLMEIRRLEIGNIRLRTGLVHAIGWCQRLLLAVPLGYRNKYIEVMKYDDRVVLAQLDIEFHKIGTLL